MTEHLEIPSASGTFDAIAAGPADGRPVLLLHGFPRTAVLWEEQVAALGDQGFRAVAPDTRGYSPGVRPMRADAYGVSELVGDVLAVADALAWNRFDLVGHDWGGAIAWWTAARHAERLRTLTTVSTPHPNALGEAHRTDDDQRRRSQYQQDWRSPDTEARFLADDAALLRSLYQGKVADHHVDSYVQRLSEPGALSAALNYYRADRPDAAVGKIQVPTLYVWGTEDVALGSTAAHATEKWVSGPYSFHALQGISHWVPDEAPEVLTSLIIDHLNEHAPAL
ncbi:MULTISPECIES: alpha/beta fold hydrolase [Streptomyces]|uniref:Alpha beta hydrolase n=6 Tax=Streptomyces TaxID=1883 RepID=L7F5D8_STRT8|nr:MULTISPECIES: alpha/beta hydrolase [Streptomyces]MBP5872613.1 alpha/beta hydrolase [Streptomyces sp. LBUM 1485]MBP5933154.1 alpha/beta hydrolase [Streptomyces sp. LBUM 1479]ELP66216.1 alpha beta hydrolase [Streptomyces turgidiscabies Car8]KFG05700.1 haloalkane dehalogenase [Streptomyces scabiei]KND42111.1 haloalkane dehalogenase [Streptomyces stelliscabiei]